MGVHDPARHALHAVVALASTGTASAAPSGSADVAVSRDTAFPTSLHTTLHYNALYRITIPHIASHKLHNIKMQFIS